MKIYLISTIIAIFTFLPILSNASCAGLKNCNACYDTLLAVEKEDVSCNADNECIAIPHRCGNFYYLNKNHYKKYVDKNLKIDQSKTTPDLVCRFHNGWQIKACQQKK